jgi:hypothetical protein
MLSPVTDEPTELLAAALDKGSITALGAWTATGRAGLLVLRNVLAGTQKLRPTAPDVYPRDVIDNMSAAVADIAAAHPYEFLDVFADDRLDGNTLVLTGLGQIDDERATERLARATQSRDEWARMHAAIGLGRRSSPVATDALARLLKDREYLVRYHALRSLERIGAAAALPSLRAFASAAPIERELAGKAIASITRRSTRAEAGR